MMNVIGIRVTPKKIFYSIVQFRATEFFILNQILIVPASFDTPQKLKYVRKTMLDIFNEYNITRAGIRETEAIATPDQFRTMLEGVIHEMMASSRVEYYFAGAKNTIAAKLGLKNDGAITELMDGSSEFRGITNWQDLDLQWRESILAAFASAEL